MARVEDRFEIPVEEPAEMADEDIILVILRRLVAGRALLGYELAAERGLLSEEKLNEKVVEFHAGSPENVDPERVAWLLAGLLGEMPEPDVVELCSSATLGDAVEACRVVEAERRGEEIVSGPSVDPRVGCWGARVSVDSAVCAMIASTVARVKRAERDRLARILLKHGLAAVARDVECADDDGDGAEPCAVCAGHRTVERYERGCLRYVDCEDCGGDGRHKPRVTA